MIVESQLQAIADSGKNVMVSGGNLYALNGVKHVIDAPMTATEYVIVDETIPLYEMILHGCVDYTGQALNTIVSDDWQAKLLKMVEYGASPRYLYLKIDRNVQAKGSPVHLRDIAGLYCSAKQIENKVRTLRLPTEVIRGPEWKFLNIIPVQIF